MLVDNPHRLGLGGATDHDGRRDIQRAAEDLAGRLPAALAPLARLAYNYRWSWLPHGPELFAAVDPARFELCLQNPVRLLQEASARALARAAEDEQLLDRADRLEALVAADMNRRPAESPFDEAHPVAFLCAEYAVHVSLPVYSGGLGALAGDLLKEASDAAVPLVAVGLMYRKGYFRQRVDASGWQQEYWLDTDPERLPAALVTDDDDDAGDGHRSDRDGRRRRRGSGASRSAACRSSCSTPTVPENAPLDRWITGRLYDGDPETRLAQYALLGVGGVRALRALGYEPGVIHLNEGHAALAPLELARDGDGDSLDDALARARDRTVFTTHTPVPAGNDSYPPDQVEDVVGRLAVQLGCTAAELVALGRDQADDPWSPFGVTQAALRMSRASNAVSRRHGEVARDMWHWLWPDASTDAGADRARDQRRPRSDLDRAAMRELLDRQLGAGWIAHAADPATWAAVDSIPAHELWSARGRQRAGLVGFVARRSVADRLLRGDLREYVDLAARAFDPDVLTIGFARRVATYKRLDLLTRDPEWTLSLLAGDRPVQVVLAGKAHPRDVEAKRVLQSLFGLKAARIVGERVVFLDDYDLQFRRLAGARMRRVAQPAPAAARGERHERHEVGVQRRPAAERARRLVGRGVRRLQRVGDPRRGRLKPPCAGRARRGRPAPPDRR